MTVQVGMRRYYELETDCRAGADGDCTWEKCPQLRDKEPMKSGRHCPFDILEVRPPVKEEP